ncbi:cyclin-like protein [Auriculariales sp. MPI-PUGE-AT-0066]|nr:cyclin-like protein [Auriculariales sp. MPI-PUGE-AT-0066]
MKDTTNTTATHTRGNRPTAYPKKRPSPGVRDGGIVKRKNSSPVTAASVIAGFSRKLAAGDTKLRLLVAQQSKLDWMLEPNYRNEILEYMHDMEVKTMCNAASMDQQPEIRWEMRQCLVDFIVECHQTLRLRPETLYLTFNILDRYVSRRIVYMKHYQLVGCTALWIAAKFEDAKDRTPSIQDLAELCQHAYEPAAFTQMEMHVLTTIQWLVGHPTAEAWLRIACIGGSIEDSVTQHVARFLMEISLFHRCYINCPASTIASGALCLARHIMGKQRRLSDESSAGLEVVNMLDDHLSSNIHELSEALIRKYSASWYSRASKIVLEYYLKGNRFEHSFISTCPPITPVSSASTPRTPLSATSSRSSMYESDDMPATPGTPTFDLDSFPANPRVLTSKDNLPLQTRTKIAQRDDASHSLQSSPISTTAYVR